MGYSARTDGLAGLTDSGNYCWTANENLVVALQTYLQYTRGANWAPDSYLWLLIAFIRQKNIVQPDLQFGFFKR